MTTHKIRFSLVILLLSAGIIKAQEPAEADSAACFTRHEFSVYAGGGLSTLLYKMTDFDRKNSLGGHFGLGYHFFFNKHWALGTGLEVEFYRSRLLVENFYSATMTTDGEGNPFEFRSTVSATEKQTAAMLRIPLMLQYQTAVPNRRHQFFAAAGAKVGFPISGKYRVTDASAYNTGYYEYENYEYTEQTFMGFGRFEGRDSKGSVDFGTALFASAEAGVKWKLNWKGDWSLYTGLYFDYGLNNIKPDDDANPYVRYNPENPSDFHIGSAFITGNTGKVKPLAFGLKVRLAFGKKKCPPPPAGMPPAIPVADKPVEETPEKPADEPVAPAEPAKLADEPAQPVAEPAKPAATEEPAKPAVADKPTEPAPEPAKPAGEKKPLPDVKSWDDAARAIAAAKLKPVADYTISHTELSAAQKKKWDENIAVLNMYPDMKVFIYGHTCNMGNAEINELIGKQRAETVKAYLLSKGIAPGRILGTASKRDTEPAAPNDTEQHRRDNRRVELVPM